MEVELFIPCTIDQIYPDTGFNLVKILEKLDIKVHYNSDQTCCGQIAFNNGYWDEARELGEKFIKDFNTGRVIIGLSASCINTVKTHYPKLFHNSSLHNKYNIIKTNIIDISDFLVNQLNVTNIGAIFPHKVTIHDSCTANNEYNLTKEVRTLLSQVKDLEIIEMQESDASCGFGGSFSIKNESISTAMTEKSVQSAIDTGAEYLICTEASCLMNIDAYIKRNKLPIKAIHLVDVLANGWELV